MDGAQIRNAIEKDKQASKGFLGVFAKDTIPKVIPNRKPVFYIVNTDVARGPGKHWVTIFHPEHGPVEFMDSAGHAPGYYGFKGKFKHYPKRLQAHDSMVCGHYAVFFAIERMKRKALHNVYKQFGTCKNRDCNDQFVRKYYFKLLNR